MTHPLLEPPDDTTAKDQKLPIKKTPKVIAPISHDLDADDVLAELKAKTEELKRHYGDDVDGARQRVLDLQADQERTKSTSDILQEMNKNLEQEQAASSRKSLVHDFEPKSSEKPTNPAVDMIRNKLSAIYKKEPNAQTEAEEAKVAGNHRSKHQKFMFELTTSGKSLADIQTEWHNYYVALPDDEKHQVWQEFYEMQHRIKQQAHASAAHTHHPAHHQKAPSKTEQIIRAVEPRSVAEIRASLTDKLTAGGRLKAKHHVKSLLFGLGLAGFVGLVVTFTFFNEVFIAPFISPSRSVSATPILSDPNGPVGPEPKIIIPKINLEVPVVYDLGTTEEKAIQNALEDGVVHYATTPTPGQQGNVVIVGHSSNNILNQGKYKFAFVLLKRLEAEDTFYLHKDGVRYTYKVFEKRIVAPDDVSVLQPNEKGNTVTLITCDPPGTSINRLVIVAEQVSPDPSGNTAATPTVEAETPEELPSNAPSLWSRLFD